MRAIRNDQSMAEKILFAIWAVVTMLAGGCIILGIVVPELIEQYPIIACSIGLAEVIVTFVRKPCMAKGMHW